MAVLPKTKKTKTGARPRPRRSPIVVGSAHTVASARPVPSDESRRIALLASEAGLDKKAVGVDILDVTGKVDYADFLVLMTGQNERHVTAIAHAVEEFVSKSGTRAVAIEGLPGGRWVLIDFVDVVVHVFLQDARSLYDLDGLWIDARRIPVPAQASTRAGNRT
jgi:ribosome-associated protein